MPSVNDWENEGVHVEEGDELIRRFSWKRLRVANPLLDVPEYQTGMFSFGSEPVSCVALEKTKGEGKGSEIVYIPRDSNAFSKIIKASK